MVSDYYSFKNDSSILQCCRLSAHTHTHTIKKINNAISSVAMLVYVHAISSVAMVVCVHAISTVAMVV